MRGSGGDVDGGAAATIWTGEGMHPNPSLLNRWYWSSSYTENKAADGNMGFGESLRQDMREALDMVATDHKAARIRTAKRRATPLHTTEGITCSPSWRPTGSTYSNVAAA